MNRLWVSRFFIGLVLFLNIQCAVIFLVSPQVFAPMYELKGLPGQFAVQGIGLLFIMWNIPYVMALINPNRHFISLLEAVIMQAVGVTGESLLYFSLPVGHQVLQSSMTRFIWFDAGGLLTLLTATWIVWNTRNNAISSHQ